jgi:hypothetical protein
MLPLTAETLMTQILRRSITTAITLSLGVFAACGGLDDDPCDAGPTAPGCGSGIAPGDADISADITTSRTLYKDTTYTLTNFIHVANGATLTIQPGTTIKGRVGSALFVMRGAKIDARGREDAPIVFTSDQAAGSRKPGDWGGLVIIGRGVINRTGAVLLEGTGSSAENPSIDYAGGADNADDSGTLQYVRVEFAGFGVAANQELNAVTLAGVGSGTTIDHVQTLAGLDDSFEWFGGAVDGKYLVSYASQDDHFDPSEGYVGRNQYLIAFQRVLLEPRAGSGVRSGDPQGFEVDGCGSASGGGCTLGYNSTPLNIPMFANFTVIGTGNDADVLATSGGYGLQLRRGTGGYWVNGILARWPRAAISLRDAETQARFTAGEAMISNVSVVETGTTAGTNGPIFETGTGRFSLDAAANAIVAEEGTVLTTGVFSAIPAAPTTATLDFSLVTGAAARTGGTGAFTGALLTKGGTFVTGTAYRGAWDPSAPKWWQNWTNYAEN